MLLPVLVLFIHSCGSGGGPPTPAQLLQSSEQMMRALPLIKDEITTSSLLTVNELVFDETVSDAEMINQLFKFECSLPPDIDICPPGTPKIPMSPTSIIGLVGHAEMKARNVYGEGQSLEACHTEDYTLTDNKIYYTTGDGDEKEGSSPMVLSMPGTLECLNRVSPDECPDCYTAYSRGADGVFAFVSTGYENPFPDYDSTDVFQGYMEVQEDGNAVIAFNLASFHDKTPNISYAVRTILLANPVKHKFAIKSYQTPEKGIIAIGKGGIDRNGKYNEGHFIIRVESNGSTKLYCMENAATPEVVDEENCSDIIEKLGGTGKEWTNANIAAYLGITSNEVIEKFISGDPLPAEGSNATGLKNTNPIDHPQHPCVDSDNSTCSADNFPETLSNESS